MRIGILVFSLAVLATALLSACGGGGGGGGGGGTGINRPPVAVAGAGATGVVGELLTLNGSASSDPDGHSLTYSWTLTSAPAGNTASLTGANTASPSIRPNVSGAYVVSLVVSDGLLLSNTSTANLTVTVNSLDLARQTRARLTGSVDSATLITRLDWFNTFANSGEYRIERQDATGVFTAVANVQGTTDAATRMTWTAPFTGPTVYRVIGIVGNRELPLLTLGGEQTVHAVNSPVMSIAIDAAEPLAGQRMLSVANLPAGASVRWFLDHEPLGAAHTISWDTSEAAGVAHLLHALVDLGNGVSTYIRRPATVAVQTLAISADLTVGSETLRIMAAVTSPFAVGTVSAQVDNGTIRTLGAPNTCVVFPSPCVFDRYRFEFLDVLPGQHTLILRASDANGNVKQISRTFTVFAAEPLLTVTSPTWGGFVSGSVHLEGSYQMQNGQPATVTARFGNTQFLSTTNQNFSADFSLAGVAPGQYDVVVTATAPNGAQSTVSKFIRVTSTAALAHQPLITLPRVGVPGLVGASDTYILYYVQLSSTHYVYDVATGTSTPLQVLNSPPQVMNSQPGRPVFAGNWIFSTSPNHTPDFVPNDPECPQSSSCVYRWSAITGATTNLSADDPAISPQTQGTREVLASAGKYILWKNRIGFSDTLTLYDSVAETFTSIAPPAPGLINFRVSIGLFNGDPIVFFFMETGGALYQWTPTTGLTLVFTLPVGVRGDAVLTDGETLAWVTSTPVVNGNVPRLYSISMRPVAGGATTVLDSNLPAGSAMLRDGVLAWATTGVGLDDMLPKDKARSVQRGVVTLGSGTAVGSGFYFFNNAAGEQSWNGATGATRVIAEGGPYSKIITANWIYFQSGQGIYRLPLN